MPRSCSTTMRADDSVLVGEHSPLLADSTSGEKIRARVSRDESASQAFNRRPGLFAIGAVAVCGVLALANGPSWRYAASAHSSLASVSSSLVPSAGKATHDTHHSSKHASQPKSTGDAFAGDTEEKLGTEEAHGMCDAESMARAAHDKGVFTYQPPQQCKLMVVCAGSPRAASTAHCMIAEHIIDKLMKIRNVEEKLAAAAPDAPVYAGYWNYHLHAVCSDGKECPLFDGKDASFDEFKDHIYSLPGLDGKDKKGLDDSMTDVKASMEHLASKEAEEVIIVKSHEYDATLMAACEKRLVLTSWREKEDVFDSGLELGWFPEPKESSREVFDEVYGVWCSWHNCWSTNAEADGERTQNHDLGFEALNSKEPFKTEIKKLTLMAMKSLSIAEDTVDVDNLVNEITDEDFHEELNPMLSNGNQDPPSTAARIGTRKPHVNWRTNGNL